MTPDFEAVRDKRMSELTPSQQEDARELWIRMNLHWGVGEEHMRFLLERLDAERAENEQLRATVPAERANVLLQLAEIMERGGELSTAGLRKLAEEETRATPNG